MAEITIDTIGASRDWTGDHGTFRIYDVTFNGGQPGQVKKKADSPAPTAGERFDGEIVQKGNFPPELKRTPKALGGGGGKSPQERAEIRRMNAQGNALRLFASQVAAGKAPPEGTTIFGHLKPIIDWFQKDTEDAGKAA